MPAGTKSGEKRLEAVFSALFKGTGNDKGTVSGAFGVPPEGENRI